MQELHLTPEDLALKAHLDPSTIRRITRAEGWPREHTRHAIEEALDWTRGAFVRLAGNLHNVTCAELKAELEARCSGI